MMTSLLAALITVSANVPQTFTLICDPASAPVRLEISQPLNDVYTCEVRRGSAYYEPVAKSFDVRLGTNQYTATVQPFNEPGSCQATLSSINLYLHNDTASYIAALSHDGAATVSRFATVLCSSGQPD